MTSVNESRVLSAFLVCTGGFLQTGQTYRIKIGGPGQAIAHLDLCILKKPESFVPFAKGFKTTNVGGSSPLTVEFSGPVAASPEPIPSSALVAGVNLARSIWPDTDTFLFSFEAFSSHSRRLLDPNAKIKREESSTVYSMSVERRPYHVGKEMTVELTNLGRVLGVLHGL